MRLLCRKPKPDRLTRRCQYPCVTGNADKLRDMRVFHLVWLFGYIFTGLKQLKLNKFQFEGRGCFQCIGDSRLDYCRSSLHLGRLWLPIFHRRLCRALRPLTFRWPRPFTIGAASMSASMAGGVLPAARGQPRSLVLPADYSMGRQRDREASTAA